MQSDYKTYYNITNAAQLQNLQPDYKFFLISAARLQISSRVIV